MAANKGLAQPAEGVMYWDLAFLWQNSCSETNDNAYFAVYLKTSILKVKQKTIKFTI